jgi:hypothetical protein
MIHVGVRTTHLIRGLRGVAAAVIVLVAATCGSAANVGHVASSSPTPSVSAVAATTAPATPVQTQPPKASDAVASSVWCGVLVPNSITTGEGSAPNSYQLASPTGVRNARFVWLAGASALGTYVCARLIGGAPMSGFNEVVNPGEPGYVAQATAAIDSCGSVTRYAADGAHMLVTLLAGGVTTQYDLQYQFAGDAAPTDIGTQFSKNMPQMLLITGRQFPPDSGAANAINLHDYNVARVTSCTPLSSVTPQPTGFTLPLGCAYIDQPVVGGDQSTWKFDCGWATHDARGTLAPAFTAQGWTGCGVGLGGASWKKGSVVLAVTEGAGGFGGYPQLLQPRPGIQTACP